jgi:hypothetical protein
MRSSRLLSLIAVAIGLIILGAVVEARAGIWLPKSEMISNLANGSSGLVVEIKKKKHHEDNDEDSQSAKEHHDNDEHDKSGQNGEPSELTSCTIIGPNGGMGCGGGNKLKCETLTNGQKCCSCVPPKPAN